MIRMESLDAEEWATPKTLGIVVELVGSVKEESTPQAAAVFMHVQVRDQWPCGG
jgi:hypothetical protein